MAFIVNPGAIIDSKYEVISKIDKGGHGMVYRVRRLSDQVELALKIADTFGIDDDDFKRLKREIRLMQKIDHPNVVSILDSGEFDDTIYFVMPIARHSLKSEITKLMADHVQALEAFEQACVGVAALHKAGVYHRDIEPATFLRLMDGRVAVSDLGSGRFADRDTDTVTTTQDKQGTPAYRAPEQATPGGARQADSRTDVFLLGKTLYQLLTGDLPFHPDINKLPHAVRFIFSRSTSISKDDRYYSATGFI